MNVDLIYANLAKADDVELYITDKEIDERNKVLSFLLKHIRGNIGKINYSSKVYLDYTLIDLLLKSSEAKNEKGLNTKKEIFLEIINDEGFQHTDRDIKEIEKLLSDKTYGSLVVPAYLERVNKDKEKGLLSYAQHAMENLYVGHMSGVACYYAYGARGVYVFTC